MPVWAVLASLAAAAVCYCGRRIWAVRVEHQLRDDPLGRLLTELGQQDRLQRLQRLLRWMRIHLPSDLPVIYEDELLEQYVRRTGLAHDLHCTIHLALNELAAIQRIFRPLSGRDCAQLMDEFMIRKGRLKRQTSTDDQVRA